MLPNIPLEWGVDEIQPLFFRSGWLLKDWLNQKLKLMIKAPGYDIYSNFTKSEKNRHDLVLLKKHIKKRVGTWAIYIDLGGIFM